MVPSQLGTGVLPAGSAGHSSATTFRPRFCLTGGFVDRLASLLLRSTGRVHLPVGGSVPDGFVDHLEIDLAERGWLLDPAARAAFAAMDGPRRTAWADWLLATADADAGADRPHVPLFRRFPDSIPANTEALYVERVLAFLLQEPEQPCVLCGRENTVAPVSPCGHLICRSCWSRQRQLPVTSAGSHQIRPREKRLRRRWPSPCARTFRQPSHR